MINRFNIRVYGLLIWESKLLIVHETIGDIHFTKFPGGGLEFGEGLKDCLCREFKEEANFDIEVDEHFYTTDFFQQSAFKETDQLISVYYKVKPLMNPEQIRLDRFETENNGRIEQLQFEWIPFEKLNDQLVTFPIDKHVMRMLQQSC